MPARIQRSSAGNATSSRVQSQIARSPTLSRESRSPLWTARNAQSSSGRKVSGGRRLVVGVDELLGLLEALLGPVRLRVSPGLDQVEVGRRHQQVLACSCPRWRGATRSCASSPNGRRCCGLGRARLALGVVEGPLVERDDPLPGCLDHLLAELDGLGQDDLFLGGQQGDLADLLEVHPDRVVDPDHVGRDRLELLGGGLLDLLRVELRGCIGRQLRGRVGGAVIGDHDDADVRAVLADGLGPSSRSRRLRRRRRRRPRRPAFARVGRRPASLASSRSALARRGRDRTASTSCLSRGSADMGYLR